MPLAVREAAIDGNSFGHWPDRLRAFAGSGSPSIPASLGWQLAGKELGMIEADQ